MEFINEAVLHAAGQWWIYPILLVFFFVDGFAMVVPSETLIVALAAFSRQSGEPNLWILGVTALVGAIAGDNMAYMLGRKIGLERWRWMRKPKVQKVFAWAHYELEKRGAVLIFTARYIPWGRVAVNYVAGTTAFPHRRFFILDALACVTWVGYSIGIGLLASSFPCCMTIRCSAPALRWCSPSSSASSSTTCCAGGTNGWDDTMMHVPMGHPRRGPAGKPPRNLECAPSGTPSPRSPRWPCPPSPKRKRAAERGFGPSRPYRVAPDAVRP